MLGTVECHYIPSTMLRVQPAVHYVSAGAFRHVRILDSLTGDAFTWRDRTSNHPDIRSFFESNTISVIKVCYGSFEGMTMQGGHTQPNTNRSAVCFLDQLSTRLLRRFQLIDAHSVNSNASSASWSHSTATCFIESNCRSLEHLGCGKLSSLRELSPQVSENLHSHRC